MAKYRAAGSKKAAPPINPNRGLIPCGLLALAAFAIVFTIMYYALQSKPLAPPPVKATTPAQTEKAK